MRNHKPLIFREHDVRDELHRPQLLRDLPDVQLLFNLALRCIVKSVVILILVGRATTITVLSSSSSPTTAAEPAFEYDPQKLNQAIVKFESCFDLISETVVQLPVLHRGAALFAVLHVVLVVHILGLQLLRGLRLNDIFEQGVVLFRGLVPVEALDEGGEVDY